jgi:hypothetical protein
VIQLLAVPGSGYSFEVWEGDKSVALHAAAMLLEQAKPQTLYTQVVNYTPLKHYNSTHSYLQYLGMVFYMVCETEGHCFEFWSLGAVLGKWTVWWLGYNYVSMIELSDGMFNL